MVGCAAIDAVLDEGLVCHVGFLMGGRPLIVVAPYARDGGRILIPAADALGRAAEAGEVCVTISLLDGLVLARSAIHHTVNYRVVTLRGRPERVTGMAEKLRALRLLTDRLSPGRWDTARAPNEREVDEAGLLAVSTAGARLDVRSGPPAEAPEDRHSPVWAGIVPLTLARGPLITHDPIQSRRRSSV